MKGMLSKAFSLALLISVVPSFAMDVKKAAEEVVIDPVIVIDNAAQKVAEATSTETTVKNALVSGVVVPSVWEKTKALGSQAYNYVANSKLPGYANTAAGYAHSALVAPFNYTVGALANRFGLADRVSNIGFVKNDSYYGTTLAKYAFGLAAAYAGYKAATAAYKYVKTPATKKAEFVKPAAVAAPVAKQAPRTCKTEKQALFGALKALYKKATTQGTLANSQELNALRAFDFLAVNTTLNGKPLSLTDGLINKNVKSYFAQISELASDIDFARNHSATRAQNLVESLNTLISTIEVHFNMPRVVVHEKLNFKAEQAAKDAANDANRQPCIEKLNAVAQAKGQYTPGFITRAYNALVNRYTLGAATVAGLGYAGYKYGVPFYNIIK